MLTDDKFLNDRDIPSDTPRTDAAQDQIRYVGAATLEYVHADFARHLERELTAARAELANLRNDWNALQHAIVGDTGASAMLTVEKMRAENVECLQAWRKANEEYYFAAKERDAARAELERAIKVVEAAEAAMCIEFPKPLRDAMQRWWDEEAGR
jgi:hypothetical protein